MHETLSAVRRGPPPPIDWSSAKRRRQRNPIFIDILFNSSFVAFRILCKQPDEMTIICLSNWFPSHFTHFQLTWLRCRHKLLHSRPLSVYKIMRFKLTVALAKWHPWKSGLKGNTWIEHEEPQMRLIAWRNFPWQFIPSHAFPELWMKRLNENGVGARTHDGWNHKTALTYAVLLKSATTRLNIIIIISRFIKKQWNEMA